MLDPEVGLAYLREHGLTVQDFKRVFRDDVHINWRYVVYADEATLRKLHNTVVGSDGEEPLVREFYLWVKQIARPDRFACTPTSTPGTPRPRRSSCS